MYDSGWTFGTAIDALKDNLKGFFLALTDGFLWLLDKLTFGDANKKVKEAMAASDAEHKRLKDAETARDNERTKIATERETAKQNNKLDQKLLGLKNSHADGLAAANKKEQEARDAKTDMNTADSVALLGQELKSQKSNILPKAEAVKKESDILPKAEAAKKEIEQKGVAKQADDAKTKADAEAKVKAEQETKAAATPVKTQESAESLLANLNTKMDQLVKYMAQTTTNTYQQVQATQALGSDVHKAA